MLYNSCWTQAEIIAFVKMRQLCISFIIMKLGTYICSYSCIVWVIVCQINVNFNTSTSITNNWRTIYFYKGVDPIAPISISTSTLSPLSFLLLKTNQDSLETKNMSRCCSWQKTVSAVHKSIISYKSMGINGINLLREQWQKNHVIDQELTHLWKGKPREVTFSNLSLLCFNSSSMHT